MSGTFRLPILACILASLALGTLSASAQALPPPPCGCKIEVLKIDAPSQIGPEGEVHVHVVYALKDTGDVDKKGNPVPRCKGICLFVTVNGKIGEGPQKGTVVFHDTYTGEGSPYDGEVSGGQGKTTGKGNPSEPKNVLLDPDKQSLDATLMGVPGRLGKGGTIEITVVAVPCQDTTCEPVTTQATITVVGPDDNK